MSVVAGFYGGVQATQYQDRAGLSYCTDIEIRRSLAMEIELFKRRGMTNKQLAKKYRFTVRYIQKLAKWARESGCIPEEFDRACA